MTEEKYDPIEEVNKADLCIHCINHNICLLEEKLDNVLYEINKHIFGYGFHRFFSEVAKICKKYKRIIR